MKTGTTNKTPQFEATEMSLIWSRGCQIHQQSKTTPRIASRAVMAYKCAMVMQTLIEQLPPLYKELLPQEFQDIVFSEPLATCSNCRMCEAPKGTYQPGRPQVSGSQKPFLSTTKCCTFYPFIANYLVGGALTHDKSPLHPFRELIRQRQWALPIGVVAPPSYQKKHREKKQEEFGRRDDLLCPFYISQGGLCGIWQWRDSQCSTYFCASSYGQKGENFWLEVGDFIFQTEMLLSQDCMLEKGFDESEIDEALKYVKCDGESRPYSMSAMEWNGFWQHQAERVELYFTECYEMVLERKKQHQKDLRKLYREYGDRLKWKPTNKVD